MEEYKNQEIQENTEENKEVEEVKEEQTEWDPAEAFVTDDEDTPF